MKTLGLAFAIVAAAGSVVYFLFGFVLHAQEFAGGIASLVFGALPLLHQELEKQAAKNATSGIVSQPGPGPTNLLEPPERVQGIPGPAQSANNPMATAATPVPTPSLSRPSAEPYATNPVPVYVSSVTAPGAIGSPAQSPPVAMEVTVPPATGTAISRTRPTNWVVIFVYSIAVVIAVRGASDFTRLLYRWFEGVAGHEGISHFEQSMFVFIGSWLPLLIVGVGVFLVGLWIGWKSPSQGWLITIGAVVLGLLFARLINVIIGYDESDAFVNDYLLPRDQASVDWRFANPEEYDKLKLTLSWAFIFGMVVCESIVALAGYWLGKRLRRTRVRG